MPRSAMVFLMVVLPGGLLIVGAWLLARLLAERMQLESGPQSQRLVRAVATLRWQDLWTQARRKRREAPGS